MLMSLRAVAAAAATAFAVAQNRHGSGRYFTTRFPRLLLTTYKFAEQHCSADPPLRDYFPHVPLQAGLPPPALPLPSAQATLEDASTGQLPSAATGPLPLMPLRHPSKAQALEAPQPLTSSPGNAAKDGPILLDKPQVPDVLSTPHLVGQQGDLQHPRHAEGDHDVTENTLSHAGVPPPWTDHPSTAAAAGRAAHGHRQTWWPKQDSHLFTEPACRDDSPLEQQPIDTNDHTVDSSVPPKEASGMVPRAWKSADVSDHNGFLPVQQRGGSKRPAAASAAWCIQQQGAQGLDSGAGQSCLKLQSSIGSEDGAGQQLGDEAWPPLPAQLWSLPIQQQQQQLAPAEPKAAVSQQHIDQLQQAVLGESQTNELSEDDMHCSSAGAGQKPYDCSSASIMPSHPGQSVVAPQLSKDAGLHLAPASALSETCTDAVSSLPQRPGQTSCDFYVRTGFCKFGEGCKFDHPPQFAVCLNSLGLPLRAQEPTCPFYAKTGNCKFGPSCKFDHPEDMQCGGV